MHNVLIVEDSETIRTELKVIIESINAKVLLASNGIEGLQEFEKNNDINLILSDIYMPVMDGLEMCEKISTICKEKKSPKILMITTETNVEMKKRAKSFGVTGWILKPFDPEAIAEVVKEILNKESV